jgi:hypothetical protein
MAYIGADSKVGNFEDVNKICDERQYYISRWSILVEKGLMEKGKEALDEADKLKPRLVPLSYTLTDRYGNNDKASLADLNHVGDMLDTGWTILVGIDRADPLKTTPGGARTIVSCLAKGQINSNKNPFQSENPIYIYLLLGMLPILDSSMEGIKNFILDCNNEYGGVNMVCSERWGIWDLKPWCDGLQIQFEAVAPSYDKQKSAFSELYISLSQGAFKAPELSILGSQTPNILKEEFTTFKHDTGKKWFGSVEKDVKDGIQDDAIYSIAWAMYGGREIKADQFTMRNAKAWFGTFIQPDRGHELMF